MSVESGIRRLSTTSSSTCHPSSLRSTPTTTSGRRPVSSVSCAAAARATFIAEGLAAFAAGLPWSCWLLDDFLAAGFLVADFLAGAFFALALLVALLVLVRDSPDA